MNEKSSMDEPCILSFVCADDREEVNRFQELTSSMIPVNEVSTRCCLLIKEGARKEET